MRSKSKGTWKHEKHEASCSWEDVLKRVTEKRNVLALAAGAIMATPRKDRRAGEVAYPNPLISYELGVFPSLFRS